MLLQLASLTLEPTPYQGHSASKIQSCKHLDYNYHERLQHLQHLGLFSLQRRRERYIIIHMWKVLHGLSPNDLNITFGESGRLGIKAKLPAELYKIIARNQISLRAFMTNPYSFAVFLDSGMQSQRMSNVTRQLWRVLKIL